MRNLLAIIIITLASGCASGPGPVDPKTGMTASQRNLCVAMRSYEPYRPGECGGVN